MNEEQLEKVRRVLHLVAIAGAGICTGALVHILFS